MEKTTATSAEKHCFTITFKDDEHAAFFWKNFRAFCENPAIPAGQSLL